MKTKLSVCSLRKLACVALGASAFTAVQAQNPGSGSTQAGLLGERYFGVTFDYVTFDAPAVNDGFGASFELNYPISNGVDLVAAYSYLGNDLDIDFNGSPVGADLDQHSLFVGTRLHTPLGPGRGFATAGFGLAKLGVDIPGLGDDSETESYYLIGAGYELPVGDRLAFTPFVTWSDFFDSDLDAGAVTYGTDVEFRFEGSVSLIGSLWVDDDSNKGVSAGMVFRF